MLHRNSLAACTAAALFATLAGARPAAAKGCSIAQSRAAETAIGKVPDWKGLHAFYATYAGCDDGGPSELISEWIVHHLAHRWSWLPQLDREIKQDPRFASFVFRHIDSTADTDDLGEIQRTAPRMCPPKLATLCQRLKTAAGSALE